MVKKFGLPTYPIKSGMIITGGREPDELEWLLDHGCLQSDLYCYLKIIKLGDKRYQLLKNEENRFIQPDESIAEAPSLQELLQGREIILPDWYWYEKDEGEMQ